MAKHRLFNKEESSPLLQVSLNHPIIPPHNVHPALLSTVRADVSKSKQMHSTPKNNTNISEHATIIDASDSNSDEEVHNFFSPSHIKLPYTKEEDEVILNYVLKGENIFKVSSVLLWKHLESKKDNPKRTYHSLKNRFMRNIKPNLFTSFGHLIKNQTTVERILKKFPELKHKMNKRETLSRITLPERRRKPQEDDEVSSTSANGSQESRIMPSGGEPDTDQTKQDNELKQKSPLQSKLSSDWYKPETCLRRVKLKKDGMTVCVNFMSRRRTRTSTLGVFEKYQALVEKNKLILCPTCGRRNRPHKVSPSKCSRETDVLIPSSQNSPNKSLKNLAISKYKKTNLNNNRLNSRSISPSLLSCSSETEKSERDASQERSEMPQVTELSVIPDSRKSKNLEANKPDASEQECVSSNTRSRALKMSSVKPNTRSNNSESKSRVAETSTQKSNMEKRNAESSNQTFEASSPRSNKNSSSGASKRPLDIDEHLDSIGEDAIANFRQLIDFEEEQLLVRKCLNKNFKSIGLEGVSYTNWDSYFLESSSDMVTPPLTIDYETDTQNNENESATETTASGASLSKNMLGKKRTRKDCKNS